ncbi:MAG: FapA family protein [Clostridia bacterium]|nr:FapA family protein [Clostridia bacterium]
MGDNIIFIDEFIKISSMNNDIYMESLKKGCSFDHLNSILISHPQISISNYNAVKSILNSAPHPAEKIGMLKERIVIDFSSDCLEAYITYNMTKEELDIKNRENLIRETDAKIAQAGIITGVTKDFFMNEIHSAKRYLIAKGIPPIKGNDSVIKMYKLEDSKPEINKDGTVDFYELRLINRVKAGDWLGERLEATKGVPGTNIKGEPIKSLDGKNINLNYDKNSVMEISENNITTLYSKINGAVSYCGDKIMVSNHLEIDGDVDFKTGNIKFDGYVTIKGTVTDGFYVEATKDIEINGQLGLGNVKGITSTHGSIFIKGGIASKGHVEIKAAKNVFTKFVDDTTINCGGTIHIGFYCINSTLKAKEVIIDSSGGHIIGGNISAEIRVVVPIAGSEMEKKTVIEVTGFNRDALNEELQEIFSKINALKAEQQKIKQLLAHFDGHGQLNPFQRKEYNENYERMTYIKDKIKELEENKKDIAGYLKARGEGEINITKKAYPNCTLHIRKSIFEITTVTLPTIYYYQDGELKHT